MGVSDDHLELLLIDENKWIESLEEEHLLKLQEKLNNYIYFLESKQYVERYGDKFDKKNHPYHIPVFSIRQRSSLPRSCSESIATHRYEFEGRIA